MSKEEIWKPVVGYEGDYEVSSLGRVRSVKPRKTRMIPCRIKKIKHWGPRIFKPQPQNVEYLQVCLCKNNKKRSRSIYRLVAEAFIPNPDDKPCVNHINGVKSDNRLENLEWVTYKENTAHAIRTGLWELRRGEENNKAKLTAEDVIQIRFLRKFMNCVKLAKLFNVHESNVAYIVNRVTWKHI
jgi:hypothetical protein